MAVSVLPVAVVFSDSSVGLFADSVLVVVNPGALVLDLSLLTGLGSVGVVSVAVSFLKAFKRVKRYN